MWSEGQGKAFLIAFFSCFPESASVGSSNFPKYWATSTVCPNQKTTHKNGSSSPILCRPKLIFAPKWFSRRGTPDYAKKVFLKNWTFFMTPGSSRNFRIFLHLHDPFRTQNSDPPNKMFIFSGRANPVNYKISNRKSRSFCMNWNLNPEDEKYSI